MSIIAQAHNLYQTTLKKLCALEGLPALALRLYLVPIFWMAGTKKMDSFDSTVDWFGNPDWGLGLPMPWLMAFLATAAEVIGAIFLLLGFATRLIAIPLIFTMAVAAGSVHWDNGWQAISDPGAPFANERVMDSADKLERGRDILREHSNYDWITESGSFVILNNGIEFAITYLIMLMALLVLGGGRYVSLDYWIAQGLNKRYS